MLRSFAKYGLTATGATLADARYQLEETVTRAVESAYRNGLIVCVDGTVIVVPGGFQEGTYLQYREGASAGSSVQASRTWAQACEDASHHAWGAYGGVRWSAGIAPEVMESGRQRAISDELARARFWLEARRTAHHPGFTREQVLTEAARYDHLEQSQASAGGL